ncbi:hypothetical protein Aperf_G00000130644 [Anoplocephala perfoliata]
MAMQEAPRQPPMKLDHVLSVPVDLRDMEATQIISPSIHRTEELINIDSTGLDESRNQISPSAEESDDVNTSEVAKDVELLYELIDEKDAEARILKRDIKDLEECCDEVRANLEEAQTIIAEQQEQLDIYRQEVAVSKSNIEALKMRNFILASNSQGASDEIRKMVEEYQDMQDELERLRQERKINEEELQQLRKQGSFLRKRGVDQRNSNGTEAGIVGNVTDSRRSTRSRNSNPSEDSAVLIDRLRKEKQHWEEYANRLVRSIVESGLSPEELLEAHDRKNSSGDSSEDAEHWRSYAMRLLSEVVRSDPSKLTDFDRRLLRQHDEEYGTLSKATVSGSNVDAHSGEGIALQMRQTESTSVGPDRETRASFAQTRRRRIDKLKDFFRKRNGT